MTAHACVGTDAEHGAGPGWAGLRRRQQWAVVVGGVTFPSPGGSRPCGLQTKPGAGRGVSWESGPWRLGQLQAQASSRGPGGQGVGTDPHLWPSPHRTEPSQGPPVQPAGLNLPRESSPSSFLGMGCPAMQRESSGDALCWLRHPILTRAWNTLVKGRGDRRATAKQHPSPMAVPGVGAHTAPG